MNTVIANAFESINREDFVLPRDKKDAHADYPLSIGHGSTISQPSTVVFMLKLLDPKEGEKILDVGSGSGWTTALLAYIVGKKGKVWGVEIVPELITFGRENIKKYQMPQAHIEKAGEKIGFQREAPFDKILVSAAGTEFPKELIDQLKVGGALVMPIGSSIWKIDKISEVKIEKKEFPGFAFVPLR